MRIFRVQRRFAKAKAYFLPIFARQATFLKQAAAALNELTSSKEHAQWLKCDKEIKQCEVQGDAMVAEFYETLYEVLIPPLDRDDLQTIAMDLDECLDAINTAAKSVLLYSPDNLEQHLQDIAQYVDAEADAIKLIIDSLDDMKAKFAEITMQCDRITELEHAADDAYEEYIAELFSKEKNAVELMKYKNVAEAYEAATDAGKKFSDHIRKLLLRYIQ